MGWSVFLYSQPTISTDYIAFLSHISSSGSEPTTYVEAARDKAWVEAMEKELRALEDNETWRLTPLPASHKPLRCKWILKKKYKADGTIDKYKARLVAKGFKQKEGYDFFDTYSPVTRIASIWVFLAIAALHNLEIHRDGH
ncbi:hypothetical protein DH2020_025445 [Rehmannia glutinosa]|uniref:Reverse transcriptase Ty1/copia-type domain-containing protein n=1 Tax=Rehmannia glutinosa TaxID=99300 RepID=A0ABR0W3S1_REHGL